MDSVDAGRSFIVRFIYATCIHAIKNGHKVHFKPSAVDMFIKNAKLSNQY